MALYYSIVTEVWRTLNLLEGCGPRFLASPLRVRSIMIQIALIASLMVLFGQSQASTLPKSVGNYLQL